jgi:hypothetical protein
MMLCDHNYKLKPRATISQPFILAYSQSRALASVKLRYQAITIIGNVARLHSTLVLMLIYPSRRYCTTSVSFAECTKLAKSEAGIVAVSCELLTKVVLRAVPFQLTADPEINPVPFTVSAKLDPPVQ